MKPTPLNTIANWTRGEILQGIPGAELSSISTDTRSLEEGRFFVALKGENFDAHDFIDKAAEKRPSAMMVHALPASIERFEGGVIRVRDTLVALQELARNYRNSLSLKVVGITGSSGKTSTKDLVRAVLTEGFTVAATKGNLNNHIGVPLTLLDLNGNEDVSVVEMGMNHPGEIEKLAEIASPDVGIITNVGVAHIEFMKTREAIAQEKGMLAEAVGESGLVVLSAEDDFTDSIRKRTGAQVLTTGIGKGDVQAREVANDLSGCRFQLWYKGNSVDALLRVSGTHMVRNATLAAAVGLHFGLSLEAVAAGIGNVSFTGGRMEGKSAGGLSFLDDSYNANPDSMKAALRTLRDLPVKGKRIAVLGLMAELGDHAEEEHKNLGRIAAQSKVDVLIGLGKEGEWMAEGAGKELEVHVFAAHEEVAEFLKKSAGPDDLVLLKGSRSAKMESVLDCVEG